MYWPRGLGFLIVLIFLIVTPTGCSMGGRSNLDEERDPHYLEGESREAAKDGAGAAEAFHRALENDPHNASAHKKLGILYSQSLDEPESAIYHFKKLLQLRPADQHADVIKQHILLCKQKLAQSVAIGPLTKQTQDDMLRLTEENARLQKMVSTLSQQLNQLRSAAQALPSSNSPPVVFVQQSPSTNQPLNGGMSETGQRNSPVAGSTRNTQNAGSSGNTRITPGQNNTKQTPSSTSPAVSIKSTHKVKNGETFKSIATQYGVTTRSIILANPNIDPKRLRPGQTLQIPEKGR